MWPSTRVETPSRWRSDAKGASDARRDGEARAFAPFIRSFADDDSLALLFVHLLAVSMALGAIVATDLRPLSKLAQDRVRIAPPNRFVTRIVTIALTFSA